MSTNIVPTPDGWWVGDPSIAPTFIDNAVLHDGHVSVRMEKGDGTLPRYILPKPSIPVVPGDHIVFVIWMRTDPSTIGDTTLTSGVRLGVSLNGASGYITGVSTPDGTVWTPEAGGPPYEKVAANYVNWGVDIWQRRTIDFVVQSQYPASEGNGTYPTGELVTPVSITPWVQVWSGDNGNADGAIAWFADTELYVNPTQSPTALTFSCNPTHGTVPWTAQMGGRLTDASGNGVPNAVINIQTFNETNAWVYTGINPTTLSDGTYSVPFDFLEVNGWVAGVVQPMRASYADTLTSGEITVTMDGGIPPPPDWLTPLALGVTAFVSTILVVKVARGGKKKKKRRG